MADDGWRLPVETGAVWLDLVATVSGAYGPAPVERLHSPDRYARWLADEGLPPVAAPVAAVNRALAADRPVALAAGGTLRLPATAAEALARIARRAAEDLAGPAAATLGACADADCGMLYLDPGGRRRWCSAEICGVRNR